MIDELGYEPVWKDWDHGFHDDTEVPLGSDIAGEQSTALTAQPNSFGTGFAP